MKALSQEMKCRLGLHLPKVVRSGHWTRTECACCGKALGRSHFIPLMKDVAELQKQTDLAQLIEELESAKAASFMLEAKIQALLEPERNTHGMLPPNYTASIDAATGLVRRVLPGWAWRVATCCVSDDAWVFPDFNSPEHGERLKASFAQDRDWADETDVDLRPAGRPAIALCIAVLKAKQIIEV